jgi:hypothetical protein
MHTIKQSLAHVTLTALLMAVASGGQAQAGEIARDNLDAAMAECQAERQQHIEPLRQEEIQRCVDSRRGDRAYCERFNRDFGEVIQTANGTAPGLFWDLPVCERAEAARRYFGMNPRAKVYTF